MFTKMMILSIITFDSYLNSFRLAPLCDWCEVRRKKIIHESVIMPSVKNGAQVSRLPTKQ